MPRVIRGFLVATGVVAAAAALLWAGPPLDPGAVRGGHLLDGTVDHQVTQLATIAAWGVLLWLALGALLALAAQLPGLVGTAASRVSARITPAIIRRAVEAAVGAAVMVSSVGGAAAPALARSSAPSAATTATVGWAATPAPGAPAAELGDRPVEPPPTGRLQIDFDRPIVETAPPRTARRPAASSTHRSARPRPEAPTQRRRAPAPGVPGTARLSPSQFTAPPAAQQPRVASVPLPVVAGIGAPPPETDRPHVVVVVRGDSLWSIAEGSLGPGATAAEIDAEWRRWYAANRATIGPDPDVIKPGQRLHPPPG